MKTNFIHTILAVLMSGVVYGQGNWLTTAGDIANEEIKDAIFESNGDVVMTGFFTGSFDPGTGVLNTAGNTDIFVVKSDDAGNPVWAVQAGGAGVDRANAIASDNSGNTYITGYFQGNATFGSINVSGSGWEAYAAKIDVNGNFDWVTTFGGSFGDIGHDIAVDPSGNVIVTGEYKGTATFGPDVLNSQINTGSGNPSYDVFITKLDNNGNFLWTEDGNANEDDRGLGVTTDALGNIYVMGQFSQDITFQNTHNTTLLNAGFLISFDGAGNELWFDKMWGAQLLLTDIEWASNKVFLTGDFLSNVLVDDNNGVQNFSGQGDYNILVSRFSDNGDLDWFSSSYSTSELYANELTVDSNNDVYITGEFKCEFTEMNQIYGASTFMAAGFEDVHFMKYNFDGSFNWARQLASNQPDFAEAITIKNVDKPVIGGHFEGDFHVPAGGSFTFDSGQAVNFAANNCGDTNYGSFAFEGNNGQRDIFWTSPFDINRLPLDYFEKNPGVGCDTMVYEPCIGTEVVFNQCLDTLEGCQPLTAILNIFTYNGLEPNYNINWSSGAFGNTATFNSEGYYTATTTTEDACFQWLDSIYIDLYPQPDPPLISDSWNFNDYEAVPNDIDTCDADSVLIWASPFGSANDTIHWLGNVNSVDDSTINVMNSGTYSAYVTNEFGCASNSVSVDVTINNFALEDTLDPHIFFANSNIQQTDSTLTCDLPFCLNTYLVDSAFINQWGTMPNLYSVWYVNGAYYDTLFHNSDDSIEVMIPSTINLCVSDTGWHEITAHLFHECADTNEYLIVDSFYVDTIPTPYLTIDGPPAACPGDTVTITADFYTPSANWSGINIIANYGDSVDVVFSQQTGINISVTIDTTVSGVTCNNSANFALPPIPTPSVTVDPIDGTICPNDSVMFTVSGGVSWQWIGPTGDSLGTNQIQYATDVGEYFCYVTTVDGCTVASEFESAVAYSSPILYIDEPVICQGDSTYLQVFGPSNTSITWLPPLSGNDTYHYVSQAGTYYVETDFCGITKVDSIDLQISLPLANFNMPNDTSICPYDSLIVAAPPNMSEHYWNGNAGGQFYTVLDSGFYYLSIVDSVGCVDTSDTLIVNYHALPSPPVADDTTICPGGNVVLSATASGSIDWYDNLGGFIQTGSPLIVNNINVLTNYLVTNSDAFCASFYDTSTVSIFQDNVISDFVISDTCGSLSIQVENTGTAGLNYSWDFGDFTTGNGSPTTHTYPGNGTYTITQIATDPVCGFVDSSQQDVTVYGQSVSVIFNTPTCHQFDDASVTLNLIDGVGGETFLITDSLGNTLNANGTNTANNIPGGWYYWEVNLGPGCTLVDSVMIQDPLALDAALNLFHPLCYGETGSALVDTVYNWQGDYNNISFIWAPNPSGVGGVWADSAYNMLAGTYVLTINDDNGCANTVDFTIVEPDPLVFSELGYEPAYCRLFDYQSGNGVVFAAATGGTPSYNYLWINTETGDSTTNTTWGGLNPGTYEIQVTDANGCTLNDFVEVDSLNPLADFEMTSLDFDVPYQGNAPLEVQFNNQSNYFANPNNPNADTTFFWNFNYDTAPWVISHALEDVYDTTYTAGEYIVCLAAVNKNGCSDTLCKEIVVFDEVVLDPVNIFTPNGDDVNDEFTFVFKSIGIETFTCIVVNRWGRTIREFNDIHSSWDGLDKNGDECPDGVYFYVYEGVGFNGEEFAGQGTVTLVRSDN